MTSEVLKPNIKELQKDAISLLEQISSLMHRASEAFSSLYVLVNKIDQRDGDKDMNPQQVRQFVAAEFGISNDDINQVFEVSAKKAFVAANFIQELEQYPNIPVCEMKAANNFAELAFGLEAEEELEKADRERLCSRAKKLWEKSGFTSFLERAVNAILEQAAPRCIKGSLQISRNRLMELSDDVKLRNAALEQNQKNIIEEIEALKAEIGEIETRQELWEPKVDKIQNDFKTTLNACLNLMNHQFANALRDSDLKATIKPDIIKPLVELNWYEIQYLEKDVLTDILLDYLYSCGVESTKFTNQEKAIKAAQQVGDGLREFIEILISKLVQQLEDIAVYFVDELGQEIDNFHGGITNILDQGQKKLQDKFNVVLVLQQPEFNKQVISMSNLGTIAVSEHKPTLAVELHNYCIELLHLDSLIIEEELYYINLASYIPEANQIIKNAVEQLEGECKRFLEEDFQQRTNQYLMEVKGYLANYQSNLEQAINDKNLESEKFQQLKKTLDDFVSKTKEPLEKTQNLLNLTNQLLGK